MVTRRLSWSYRGSAGAVGFGNGPQPMPLAVIRFRRFNELSSCFTRSARRWARSPLP